MWHLLRHDLHNILYVSRNAVPVCYLKGDGSGRSETFIGQHLLRILLPHSSILFGTILFIYFPPIAWWVYCHFIPWSISWCAFNEYIMQKRLYSLSRDFFFFFFFLQIYNDVNIQHSVRFSLSHKREGDDHKGHQEHFAINVEFVAYWQWYQFQTLGKVFWVNEVKVMVIGTKITKYVLWVILNIKGIYKDISFKFWQMFLGSQR